jgi:hypothetical protein
MEAMMREDSYWGGRQAMREEMQPKIERLLAENKKLKEAGRAVVNEYLSPGSIGSRVEAAVYNLKGAIGDET